MSDNIDVSKAPLGERVQYALNKLAKWRSVFAAWHLGQAALFDKKVYGAAAARDQAELAMFLRAEKNALACLLIRKGVFTQEEFNEQLILEAEHLEKEYERKFPGFRAEITGMVINPKESMETMKDWGE